MSMRPIALSWGLLPTLVMALVCASALPAAAQPKKKSEPVAAPAPVPAAPAGKDADKKDDKKDDKKKDGKVQKFDFTGIDLNGRMRTPQLLYFLERANEELERASLEKRSFIPHMVRSVDEEQL